MELPEASTQAAKEQASSGATPCRFSRRVSIRPAAALATPLGDFPPAEIVYIPEGTHTIFPRVDGKPQEITINLPPDRCATIAAALQADLDRRKAGNVRPWFDFERKRGAAFALPQSFRYEPGRELIAAVEWTGAGKAAIEGKYFSYSSPEFLLNDDGTPGGLPERGPLGALVNEPAFREIPRIAASDAAPTDPTTPSPTLNMEHSHPTARA